MAESKEESKKKKLYKILSAAPKPQLHLHLDGSLSYEFVMRSAKRLKARQKGVIVFEKDWEPQNESDLFEWFSKMTDNDVDDNFKAPDNSNWRTFDICNQFLQTKEDLIDATNDIVQRAVNKHNINYIEIRFAPVLQTREGLTEEEAIRYVSEGFSHAVEFFREKGLEIHGGLILCALRSYPVPDALKVVKLVSEVDDANVLAFDIAGDEGSYPLSMFKEALQLAKELKLKITVHAGEWNEDSNKGILDNLKLAVEIGVDRIGHGVAFRSFAKDDPIFATMKAKDISVEVNLTSNCTNPKIVPCYSEHPLPKFLANDMLIAGVNIDNWLLAGNMRLGRSEPTGEYVHAIIDCGVAPDDILKIVECGYRSAFKNIPPEFIKNSIQVWVEDIIPRMKDILKV